MEINPYAAPQAQVLQTTSQDELIRKEHINTEGTMKSVGTLYYLGAFMLLLYGVILTVASISAGKKDSWIGVPIGVVLLALGLGQGRLAYGLSKLSSWARTPTIVLSSIGLLAIPLGTLINIYILVKITGKKGQFIFTPEYQRIIAATPHVKRKTSVVAWVVLIVLLLILIGTILSNMYRN
jgi:hypothetical protein